jgi:hypothetical protein
VLLADPLSAMYLCFMVCPVAPCQILFVGVEAAFESAKIWSKIPENMPSATVSGKYAITAELHLLPLLTALH